MLFVQRVRRYMIVTEFAPGEQEPPLSNEQREMKETKIWLSPLLLFPLDIGS